MTEQRRRRAQATLGPSARPPRQAAQPIGWPSTRARSSLASISRQSRLSPPLLLPEAPLAASARLQPCNPASFSRFPLPRFSQRPSRARESGRAAAGKLCRCLALCRFGRSRKMAVGPPPPLVRQRRCGSRGRVPARVPAPGGGTLGGFSLPLPFLGDARRRVLRKKLLFLPTPLGLGRGRRLEGLGVSSQVPPFILRSSGVRGRGDRDSTARLAPSAAPGLQA